MKAATKHCSERALQSLAECFSSEEQLIFRLRFKRSKYSHGVFEADYIPRLIDVADF